MSKIWLFIAILGIAAGTQSCEKDFAPKPKAYYRIDLPDKAYQNAELNNCPFSFEHPVYSVIQRDSIYFNRKVENPCMINVKFQGLGGTIHMTYNEITPEVDIAKLYENTHKFTYHHSQKADYIEEIALENNHGIEMLLNRVGGDAASPIQFYATDRKNHYLNGSLYFNVSPNADSLKPVVDFVEQDMFHLLKTLNWK